MATLSTLLPDGDSAVGSWTTDSGGTTNLYLKIDEGIAGAVDTTDYIIAPSNTTNSDYKCTLGDVNSDFGSMLTLKYQTRHCQVGLVDDSLGLSIRIMSGATVLAAGTAGGAFESADSNITSTTFINTGLKNWGYVNTTATKAEWNAAVLEIRQVWTAQMTADASVRLKVSAIEITGTYTVAARSANAAVKSAGTFATKPTSFKASGTFTSKPLKVKVGGTFIDAG